MKLNEQSYQLKNGQICQIKSPTSENVNTMITFMKKISNESENLVRYPEEVKITYDMEKEFIQNILNSPNEIMIGAFVENEVIGTVSLHCISNYMKLKHRSGIGISIIQKYQNLGLGTYFMKLILKQAKLLGYEQVELEVVSGNHAIHLYEKCGFEMVGKIPHGVKLKNGSYKDLIQMVYFVE